MNYMNKIVSIFLFGMIFLSSLLAAYTVGEQISISDQQINMNICNGSEPNGNTDQQMSLYDYNGEYNGGDYYIIYLEMSASW